MVFNDTTTEQGLCQFVDDLFSITTSDYSLRAKARNANIWLEKGARILADTSYAWQYDDPNYTNQPIATTNIVSGQRKYTMDTTFFDLLKVLVTDENGQRYVIRQVDKDDIEAETLLENNASREGIPFRYDVYGDQIVLDPTPNYNSTAGLELHFVRPPSYYLGDNSTADNDKAPGLPSAFHDYVALGMAFEYAMMRNLNTKPIMERLMKIEEDMKLFGSRRNKDRNKRMKVVSYSRFRNLGL